jgi:hypothetical protein
MLIFSSKFTAMMWKLNLAGGQRLLGNLKNLDACPLLNNLGLIPPMLKPDVDFVNETFPGMVHKCPYTASTTNIDAKNVHTSNSSLIVIQVRECIYTDEDWRNQVAMVSKWNLQTSFQSFR